MKTNRQKNFDIGYRHGMKGIPFRRDLMSYPGYEEGWDAGNSDRPTLEESMPMDVAKERSTGCLI